MGGPGSGRRKGGAKQISSVQINKKGSYAKKSNAARKNVKKIQEYNDKVKKSGKIGGK